MKVSINSRKNLRQLLYGFLILMPSVLTGNVYSNISQKQSTESMLSGLRALTDSIYSNIISSENSLDYTCHLMLTHEEFTSLDTLGMSQLLGEFLFYNDLISNAFVIDSHSNLIYGINNNKLAKVGYNSHIESALSGSTAYYSTFINNQPFIQVAHPIFATDADTTPLGALVLTYDLTPLEKRLKSLNSNSPNLNGFLLDSNGNILASSSNITLSSSNHTIDINKIKQGLDYDPTTIFTLYDDTPLNGIYYPLDNSGWTLLVTSSPNSGIQLADLISWIAGLLGIGGISTTEAIRKKVQNNNASTCQPCSDAQDNLPP